VDRHPFDPISLVFGLVFVAAGLMVLVDFSLVDDGAFLVPTGLIALGFALLYQARRSDSTPAEPATEPALDPPLAVDETWRSAGEDGPGDEVGAEGGEDGQVEEPGRRHDG
jgi:hypothetical protein